MSWLKNKLKNEDGIGPLIFALVVIGVIVVVGWTLKHL